MKIIQQLARECEKAGSMQGTSYLSRPERPNFSSASADFSPDQKKSASRYFPPHQIFTSERRIIFFSLSLKYFP